MDGWFSPIGLACRKSMKPKIVIPTTRIYSRAIGWCPIKVEHASHLSSKLHDKCDDTAFSCLPFGNVEVIVSFVAYPSDFARLRLATGFGGRFAAYGMYTLDALGLTEDSGPRS